MRDSYSIIVPCGHCHKDDPIEAFLPKDEFVQSYADRGKVYLCMSCWNKKEKGELEPIEIIEPIENRWDILDL